VDEPVEKPGRLTVGELLEKFAVDQQGAAASKFDVGAFHLGVGRTAAELDLAGLATYPGLMKLDLVGLTAAARPESTIAAAFSAYWRDQLGNAGIKTQGSIAAQISDVIAGMKLPGIGLAGIDPALLTGNLSGLLSGAFPDIAKNIGAGLAASLKPLALLATRGFAEIWQAENELERTADRALFEMGWWLPPTARMDFAAEVWRLALAGDRLAVRAEMNEASHSREFVRVVSHDWMRLPVFAARRRFFLDALADHRRGRYRVSIPTLLPHLEGIAMAAFAPAVKNAKMGKVITEAAAYDSLMGDAKVKVVTTLWDSEGFVELSPADRRLNRQRILHGRSTGYGTAVNSTKLLFTFDLLASLVEQKQRQTKA
jgi:hypothetical protein